MHQLGTDILKLALVTYEDEGKYPGEGAKEDTRLIRYLQQRGLDVKFEIWTRKEVNWQQYDAIILKSPWDYFDKIELFRKWLDILDQENVRVLNPTPMVRWNTDKRYLLEVEELGYAIVPTILLEMNTTFEAAPYFKTWETNSIILKPVVSGGAKNTFQLTRNSTSIAPIEKKINKLLQEEAFLVQPFMPEIQTDGEWSFLFFNGQFSHCIRKVPREGDFRVQHYFGGAIISAEPPLFLLHSAQQLVNNFARGCLYARVDGLNQNGTFRLMELELIEPLLYLQDNEKLYQNYYQALRQMLSPN
jgi:hypothetical protein